MKNNTIRNTLLAGAMMLSPVQAFSQAHNDITYQPHSPSITFTLMNTYEGETYPVTSETWTFEQRCDYWDWMEAIGQIASIEMNDYRVGYSGLSIDVTVRSSSGITTYHGLSQGQISGLFINTRSYQGQAIRDHEESFLADTCYIA